jgi:hypothetical protein
MAANEEVGVRELVSRTTERLKRASAGPDDMGTRYARLLELLWKPKATPAATSPEARLNNDIPLSTIPSCVPEPAYMHFSPANDFSWLDLGAVGDFVSGDQIARAGDLGFDAFQNLSMYATGQARPETWQAAFWTGDMNSLLF